jgi:hypothetical protein
MVVSRIEGEDMAGSRTDLRCEIPASAVCKRIGLYDTLRWAALGELEIIADRND